MNRLINIGFGNVVNSSKIISIISPDALREENGAECQDKGMAIDATWVEEQRLL